MLALFWFFLLFVFFPVVNAPALQRWLFKGINSSVICVVYSLFFHQALNAFVLAFLFLLVSKQPDFFYLSTIIGVNALIFWYALDKEKDFFNVLWKELSSNWIFVIFITIIFALITFWMISRAVGGDDIAYYLATARVFYREKSLFVFFSKFWPENGFFVQCAHPPLFPLLLSFIFIIQGSDITGISYLLLQTFYSIGTILLPIIIFKRNFLMSAFYIIIYSFICVAFFFPISTGVDNLYTVWILISLSILRFFLDTKDKRLLYALSISLGIMLSTHGLALIAYVLIFLILILFYQEKSLEKKYKTIMLIFLISFSIGGFKYILNLYEYNKLILDVVHDELAAFYIQEREMHLRKGFLSKIITLYSHFKPGILLMALFVILMIFNIKIIYKVLFQGIKNIFHVNKFKIPPFIECALVSFFYIIIYLVIAGNPYGYRYRYLKWICPIMIISIIYWSSIILKKIYYKFFQRYYNFDNRKIILNGFNIIVFCIAIVAVKEKLKIRGDVISNFFKNDFDYQIDTEDQVVSKYYKALEDRLKNKKIVIVGARSFFSIVDKNFQVYQWNPFINKKLKNKEKIFNWFKKKNFTYLLRGLRHLGDLPICNSVREFLADPAYVTPIEPISMNSGILGFLYYKINKEKKSVKSENMYNFYADLQEGVRKTFETDELSSKYNYMIKFSSKDPEQFYKLEITAGDKVFNKFLVKSKDSLYIHPPSINEDKFKIVVKVISLEKPVQVFINIDKVIENEK